VLITTLVNAQKFSRGDRDILPALRSKIKCLGKVGFSGIQCGGFRETLAGEILR
jgi:hypothetical protein